MLKSFPSSTAAKWVDKYVAADLLNARPETLARWRNPNSPIYKGWIEGVHWRAGVSRTAAAEYNLTALNHWRNHDPNVHQAWVLAYQSSKSINSGLPTKSA